MHLEKRLKILLKASGNSQYSENHRLEVDRIIVTYCDGGRKEHTTTKFSKISKIFLRRTVTPKILKKCMVINGKKIHFCEFF